MSHADNACFAEVEQQWLNLFPAAIDDPVADWHAEIASMDDQVARLRSAGRWRSGSRTLMHALGIHHREAYLTAGLAWLLTPDGRHGLGDRVLRGFVAALELANAITDPVTVVTEESCGDATTRADLVVRFPGRTILLEAKVFALEQPSQCDRLSRGWASESPVLVFLTRSGDPPATALESAGQWRLITWKAVAQLLRSAVDDTPDCAPGVRELMATVETYGG